jgi:hypothetical protein
MAEQARNAVRRAECIAEIGLTDPQRFHELNTFLWCDLTVMAAYRAEVKARGPSADFSLWCQLTLQVH